MYGVRRHPACDVKQARDPPFKEKPGEREMTQSPRKNLMIEAAAWHARLASDDVSERDFLEFEKWVADPECRSAFDDIQFAILDVEDHADEIRNELSRHSVIPADSASPRPASGRPWKARGALGGAIAALGTLAAAFFIVISQLGGEAAIEGVVYAAGPDSTRAITLADNTEITLNRGAEVTVYWGKTERRIVLDEGEAAFSVQHDEHKPMSVVANCFK